MIKIKHHDLESFALRHYKAIVCYLQGANKTNRPDTINVKIKKVFGDGMDLKQLVLATPSKLKELAATLDGQNNPQFSFFETLYNYFSCDNKLKDEQGDIYNGLRLVGDLDVSVCPYCNRNFIFNTDKKGRRTCDFDHFFPSGKYPFLAVSFFNLIPSCKFCNQAKKDIWNTGPNYMLINPYDPNTPFDAKFKVKIKGSAFYYKPEEIEICFEKETISERFDNHIKAFHLDTLYAQHTDYVIELIQKKYAYSDDYLNALFKQYEGTLFRNREDLLRLVTTNFVDDNDLKNRPLAKLTKDIAEQLGL